MYKIKNYCRPNGSGDIALKVCCVNCDKTFDATRLLSVAVVCFRGTFEDDIYVQAVLGLILDMLDRARQLPPTEKKSTKYRIHNL